ncbi:MAG: tRNA (guanosine(37)-N1)-methyltransferase TrmD [Lachnospiraceae bacterium]|nr:tRNA (guanosine(37)-N1)-methyltransferase TrmD [Lachnospiraceae bacterium]
MRYYVMTLFPELIEKGMNTGVLWRAQENALLSLECFHIREYTENKHKRVDDYTYGGGAGMLIACQPIWDCYKAVQARIKEHAEAEGRTPKQTRVIYLTPQGRVFDQAMAEELSKEEDLVFLCGHYEGIDERVLEEVVTDCVSIGDYVLTGGELPSLVMMDCISRLVPGVLNNDESAMTESFTDGLLEYPQYTRPEEWMGKRVPEVLLSGDHGKVEQWRLEQSLARTMERRPELYESYALSHADVLAALEKKKKKEREREERRRKREQGG